MSDTGVVRLVLFGVGGLVCAAEAERVREIVPWFEPTRIPGAPPVVAGVVNVRGTLVTVVEGWRALRQPEPAADGGGRGSGTTVLLEVGGGKKVLGFTVDEVSEIVKHDPGAKILMCSAMGQQALVVEAIQAGAKDFVVKPFQPSRVLEAVQRVLG